ncbi:hypothetical protein [Prosthecobacter sp.]
MAARTEDTRVYDNAVAFMEKHKDVPFYMNVWGHITHHPIQPQQRFVDKFASLKVKDDDFSAYQREKFATVRKHGGDVDESMQLSSAASTSARSRCFGK